jgi:PBP1b-binding outer membrane lipoprotein LpoB
MKIILTLVLLSFLMAGCSRHGATIQKESNGTTDATNTFTSVLSSDTTIQNELIGTWHRDFGHGFQITNVITADGSYQGRVVGLNNVTVGSSEGSLIAKNGVLIDTMTKNSNTNVQTPQVVQWQIVHIDKHELVMSSQFNTDKEPLVKTYEKVEQ